jgi:hypothetical protein
MPLYRAVLVHAGRPGQFKRTYLRMLTGAEIRKPREQQKAQLTEDNRKIQTL